MNNGGRLRLFALALFAAAMGCLEAVVVIYIRRILHFFPGMDFDSHFLAIGVRTIGDFKAYLLENHVFIEEQIREGATIVMLLSVAYVAGVNFKTRLAAFLWIFGIWDIAYYVFLKAMVGWPRGLLDMDCLFLLPGPWFAPVIVPVGISLIMMGFSLYLVKGEQCGEHK